MKKYALPPSLSDMRCTPLKFKLPWNGFLIWDTLGTQNEKIENKKP